MTEAHKALLGVSFALDAFYKKYPNALVHTASMVLNDQHGWNITVQGTEPTNFDEVAHTEVYR